MIVLIVLFILGVLFIAIDSKFDGMRYLGIPLVIILVILVCSVLISLPFSLGTVSDLENFYTRNQNIYQEAVVSFPDAATLTASDGTTKTTKITWDYTRQVLKYNEDLQWYRKYQNHWFLGVFMSSVPDSLKYVQFKK
ncbi:MAG: hypothetical protein LiPW41_465 [Parcubacteria group bacterium LiPW_41]|nr:MAG: hypothetical protein LiPW41_465 [Parcubacteria group bacterium LiPW_41]